MALEIALWIVQVALAAMFGYAGYIKIARPIPEIAKMFPWPAEMPIWFVRVIGIVDLAGAAGVILPELAGVLRWLTPLAALGLVALQASAIAFHATRGETRQTLAFNLMLFAGSAFVLWGRWPLFAAA